ncbi:MAG: acyl-CoA thioesterase [Lachnospiraceae bacterium]|nr:acyl-CoA thioesterase [Lachnospiraceae bacterium]
MEPYKHTVCYYETDKMGITHHANYVHWMEEARIDFFNKIGWGYEKLEEQGVISPVTAVECKYKTATTFPDEVEVSVKVSEFKGVVLKFSYLMKNADGKTVFEGKSEHCFLNKEGKLVRLNKEFPELFELLTSLAESER